MSSDNIKVVIRIRPLINREQQASATIQWIAKDEKEIHSTLKNNPQSFVFDRVFDSFCENIVVFDETVQPIVKSAMQGFNGTIFAYGQTASGKTFTIMGDERNWGVIPCSIAEIFETIENTPNRVFLLRISYMEIYNEIVTDLLSGQTNLKIHENQSGDVFVGELSEKVVRDAESIYEMLQMGEARRHFGETNMNDRSSRSHTIFRIIIESREINSTDIENNSGESHTVGITPTDQPDNVVTVSQLNIVDLAGSERASQTGATGDRLKESCAINKSLFTLAQVISKLSESGAGAPSSSLIQCATSSATGLALSMPDPQFVNFRDSKLTRILQNSLGGNSKTAIICTVTPAANEETLSTLKFANRAKVIKNKPVKNEVGSDDAMLRRCQKEVNELKKQINELAKTSDVHALQIAKDNLTKLLSEKEEKISQLMKLVCISSKIVLSPRTQDVKANMKNRRITWCPGVRGNLPAFSPFVPPRLQAINEHDLSFPFVGQETWLKDLENSEKQKSTEFLYNGNSSYPGKMTVFASISNQRLENEISSNYERKSASDFEQENIKLKEQLEDLAKCQRDVNQKLNEFEQENKKLTDQVENSTKEKNGLQSTVSLYKKELKQVRKEWQFLKVEFEQTSKLAESLQKENQNLREKHDDSTSFTQNELSTLRDDLKLAESQKEEAAKLLAENEKLKKELSEANVECENLFIQIWEANKKAGQQNREAMQRQTILEHCQAENLDLTQKLNQLHADVDDAKKTAVENDLCVAMAEIENLTAKICKVNEEVGQKNEQAAEYKKMLESCQVEKSDLLQDLKRVRLDLEELRKNAESGVKSVYQNDEALQLQFVLKQCQIENTNLTQKLDQLSVDLEQAEKNSAERETLKNDLSEANAKIECLFIQICEANQKVDEQNGEILLRQTMLEQCRNENETLAQKFDYLSADLQQARKHAVEKEKVDNDLCVAMAEIENLTAEIRKAHEEIGRLNEQETEYKKMLESCQGETFDLLQKFISNPESSVKIVCQNDDALQLQAMLEQCQIENAGLTQKLEQLSSGLEQAEKKSVEGETLKNELIEARAKVECFSMQICQANKKSCRQDGEILQLQTMLEQCQNGNANLALKFDQLSADFEQARKHAAEKEKVDNDLCVAMAEIENLTAKICKANDEAGRLNEQAAEYKNVLESCQGEKVDLLENLKRVRLDLEELRKNAETRDVDALSQCVERLTTEQKDLRGRLAQADRGRHLAEERVLRKTSEFKKLFDEQSQDNLRLKQRLKEADERLKKIATSEANKLDDKKTKIVAQPPAGTVCRSSGIVEDFNLYILDRKVYQLTQNIEKTEKKLAEAVEERDSARANVAELENLVTTLKLQSSVAESRDFSGANETAPNKMHALSVKKPGLHYSMHETISQTIAEGRRPDVLSTPERHRKELEAGCRQQ